MTHYQRTRYYNDYEREYNRAEVFAYRRFKGVLSAQIKAVLVAINQRGTIATEADITNIITDTTLKNAFLEIYTQTGQRFKDFLTQRLPKQKKANPLALIAGFYSDAFIRQMQDYALNVAGSHITSITETTRKQIKEAIAEANRLNLSVRDTAKLIRERLGGEVLKNRALLIARTETTSAANHSQYLTAKTAAIKLDKEWLVRRDGRERQWHGAMNGKVVGLDDNFTVHGKPMLYPGDPKGGADNLCNCRCTVAYVPAAEELEPVYTSRSVQNTIPTNATIYEAEKQAVDLGLALEANYKSVSIEAANVINKTLSTLKQDYDIKTIDKINTYIKKDYIGGFVQGNKLTFNAQNLSLEPRPLISNAQKTLEKWKYEREIYPERFIGDSAAAKKNRKVYKQLEESAKYKSFIVGPQNASSFEATITHEFAHLLENNIFDSRTGVMVRSVTHGGYGYNGVLLNREELTKDWAEIFRSTKYSRDLSKYQISEYAMTNERELFAETFVLFRYTPDVLPKAIFDFHSKILKLIKENGK